MKMLISLASNFVAVDCCLVVIYNIISHVLCGRACSVFRIDFQVEINIEQNNA